MKQLEQVKSTYDKTARAYAEQFFDELDGKPLDRLLLDRFARETRDKDLVLDIGCGTGHTTKYLQELGVSNLLGLDLSPDMVKVAAEKSPDIEFRSANMLSLDFDASSVTGILAMYSIVHFEYDEIGAAFAEFFRVLAQNGQVLISFHIGNDKTELDEFLGVKTKIVFNYFEVDRVIELALTAGFESSETLIRYPYEGVEYPSKRAYLTLRKPGKFAAETGSTG